MDINPHHREDGSFEGKKEGKSKITMINLELVGEEESPSKATWNIQQIAYT